jgi:cation transport ATPase
MRAFINVVVFDKTGTLTRGEFGVVKLATADNLSADDGLALAAAVERDSEHTIAKGIVRNAEDRKLAIPGAHAFEAIPGKGGRATIDRRRALGTTLMSLTDISANVRVVWDSNCGPPSWATCSVEAPPGLSIDCLRANWVALLAIILRRAGMGSQWA